MGTLTATQGYLLILNALVVRICCAGNISYRLNGKEVMLAHCGGKQAHYQEVAGGLTLSTW